VVVWHPDRLGRPRRNLIELITELDARKIGLRSVQEAINMTTPTGRLVMHVFGALAEFERELIRERTRARLAAARAQGRRGGEAA
jgi:DNA invertase Pin-like site-specific DNA recombinase